MFKQSSAQLNQLDTRNKDWKGQTVLQFCKKQVLKIINEQSKLKSFQKTPKINIQFLPYSAIVQLKNQLNHLHISCYFKKKHIQQIFKQDQQDKFSQNKFSLQKKLNSILMEYTLNDDLLEKILQKRIQRKRFFFIMQIDPTIKYQNIRFIKHLSKKTNDISYFL
ncbi:unnamed protein product [Paramecium sonneborni]|uniref:Uncharacterized protein n=1 Tax=Paramecium sonneborni TaxID=65129 RepID=A0A8S1NMZ6_9CILI|nr:unnamed protein product [Paramecium sonneborni]